MIDSVRVWFQIARIILGISLLAWGGLIWTHQHHHHGENHVHEHPMPGNPMPHHGGAPHQIEPIGTNSSMASLGLTGDAIGSWALMLVAMMTPTLVTPIQHVWERSFNRRRIRSMSMFVLGYLSVWMASGAIILALCAWIGHLAPGSLWPAAIVALVALIWQCTPFKQQCLNRNHNHHELRAFGFKADIDCLNFGLSHGWWCVGSCWALMTFPMLLDTGHLVAMIAVTFVMLSESLERPVPPRWRIRISKKLWLIIKGQTRLRIGSPNIHPVP